MLTAAYPEAAINIGHPVALVVCLLDRCVCQSDGDSNGWCRNGLVCSKYSIEAELEQELLIVAIRFQDVY